MFGASVPVARARKVWPVRTRKTANPRGTRRRMPTHSNECSSLTKLRTHDIDERVKFNSRAVNEIERLSEEANEIGGENVFLQPRCCAATNCFGRKHHVKTITRSFAGSGVHLRDSERARTAADSSTNANSARQRTTNGLIAVWPVNPQVVWASGRNGTFTVTTDGGETWNAGVVPGAEALQFRDVQAFSARVAYLMSIGNNPTDFRVYKTLDGGATWTIQSRTSFQLVSMTGSRSGRRIAEFFMVTRSTECFTIFAPLTE